MNLDAEIVIVNWKTVIVVVIVIDDFYGCISIVIEFNLRNVIVIEKKAIRLLPR